MTRRERPIVLKFLFRDAFVVVVAAAAVIVVAVVVQHVRHDEA